MIKNRIKELSNQSVGEPKNGKQDILKFIKKLKEEQTFHLKCLNISQNIVEEIQQQDEDNKKLQFQKFAIEELKKLDLLKERLFLCKVFQEKFNKILENIQAQEDDITGFNQLLLLINDEILIHLSFYYDKHQRVFIDQIRKFIHSNLLKLYKLLEIKYQKTVNQFLIDINFPNNKINNKFKMSLYDKDQIIDFFVCLEQNYQANLAIQKIIENDDCHTIHFILKPIDDAFSYHFLREDSEISRVDKPDWCYTYLYEFLEGNINALSQLEDQQDNVIWFESFQNISMILFENSLKNIENKLDNHKEEFKEQPYLAKGYFDNAYLFGNNIQQIFVNPSNVMDRIAIYFKKQQILQLILDWERYLFNENILNQMESKKKEKEPKFILDITENFFIVWKTLWTKYTVLTQDEIIEEIRLFYTEKIVRPFLQAMLDDFDQLYNLKDENYKNKYLQNYLIALRSLKAEMKTYPKYLELIQSLKQKSIKEYIIKIESKSCDLLLKFILNKIIDEYDVVVTANSDFNLYLNQGFYLIEIADAQKFQQTYMKINEFHTDIQKLVKSLFKEQIFDRMFSQQLQHKIVKELVQLLISKLQHIVVQKNIKYSLDGVKLLLQILLRTSIISMMIEVNLQNTQFFISQIQRIEKMTKLAANKNQTKFNQAGLEQEDYQFIQKLNIIGL